MYLIQIDHIVYERKGGGTFTLPEAMREVRGFRNARVLRDDAQQTVVVRDAGSTEKPWTHVPTGRKISHRLTRWAAAEWHAAMRAGFGGHLALGWPIPTDAYTVPAWR